MYTVMMSFLLYLALFGKVVYICSDRVGCRLLQEHGRGPNLGCVHRLEYTISMLTARILGTFAYSRKAPINFIVYVRMHQFGSQRAEFRDI